MTEQQMKSLALDISKRMKEGTLPDEELRDYFRIARKFKATNLQMLIKKETIKISLFFCYILLSGLLSIAFLTSSESI